LAPQKAGFCGAIVAYFERKGKALLGFVDEVFVSDFDLVAV
jgi:hypothetical protein